MKGNREGDIKIDMREKEIKGGRGKEGDEMEKGRREERKGGKEGQIARMRN